VALQAGSAYPDAVAIDEAGNLFISQSGYGFARDRRAALRAKVASASNVRLAGSQNILFIDQGQVRSIDAKTGILHTIAGVIKGSGRGYQRHFHDDQGMGTSPSL
jgi:hypothetical protein